MTVRGIETLRNKYKKERKKKKRTDKTNLILYWGLILPHCSSKWPGGSLVPSKIRMALFLHVWWVRRERRTRRRGERTGKWNWYYDCRNDLRRQIGRDQTQVQLQYVLFHQSGDGRRNQVGDRGIIDSDTPILLRNLLVSLQRASWVA